MNTEPADPPQDVDALRQALASMRDELDAKSQEIVALKLLIAKLRRMQFGRASEKLAGEIDQLELALEALQIEAPAAPADAPAAPVRTIERKPRALPDHLPREERVHMPSCTCQACGAPMRRIGEDVSEQLEFVPARFRVIRHIRPKLACTSCEAMAQSPAPSRPIVRGLPGPGLLAHVLVSKYADHIPLYRQSEIYAREGVSLERSTMADWVGQCFGLLAPLGEALADYVLASAKLHADDTPVPVLDPGRGRTKTGRLWTYVRDDRPAGNDAPPAVLFRYSPDRRGERPREHLKDFGGVLQADAYAGFAALYERRPDQPAILEAACWAHARRGFYDLHHATRSPIAAEALARIGQLYEIEAQIRGKPPDERAAARRARAGPVLQALREWLQQILAKSSKKSALALAAGYVLTRWSALTRYVEGGRIEIDNNAAERALRVVALGRKNYLFCGADAGGERAAVLYSLIGTCKLNGIDPQGYLRCVLERLPEHPINRIAELLPWRLAADSPLPLRRAA